MGHPLEYFGRIFVINLPSRPDRRREMAGQLASVGLGLPHPLVTLFAAIRPRDAGMFPSIGAKGCFLSHLGVLRAALDLGLPRVAIFEDDLDFAADFTARIGPLVDTLGREDWSIFYGGYRAEPGGGPADAPRDVAPDLAVGTTHFVAFQGSALPLLVDHLHAMQQRPGGDPRGGPMHVDGAYNWFRRAHPQMRTLLAVPPLGYQRPSRTDIHALRWFDRLPLVRNAVALLRRRRRPGS